MESTTRLGGFRALKKTPEAPYTTKVNYREPNQSWNHPERFFCCNEESGNQIILGERAVRKVAHEGECVFFTHKSYEVYDIRSIRCLHSHSARPPPHLAHGPSTSLAGLQPIERRVTPPSQPLTETSPIQISDSPIKNHNYATFEDMPLTLEHHYTNARTRSRRANYSFAIDQAHNEQYLSHVSPAKTLDSYTWPDSKPTSRQGSPKRLTSG